MASLRWKMIRYAMFFWLSSLQYPAQTNGAKILLSMTCLVNTASQHIFLSSITETLIERGHDVTLLKPQNKITKGLSPNAITNMIQFKTPYSKDENEAMLRKLSLSIVTQDETNSLTTMWQSVMGTMPMLRDGCPLLFKDTETLHRLRNEKFDMIVTFPVIGCDALLSEYLGVPFTVATPVRRVPIVSEDNFGIPIPSSYAPFSIFATLTDSMTFKERVLNHIYRFLMHPAFEWYLSRPLLQIQQEFNLRRDLSLRQMIGRASLWLTQADFSIDFAQPISPIWKHIGGITAKKPAPLPEDLEEFVQGSGEHGIIVFSLGSIVSSLLNVEKSSAIAKVFGELQQRVIWRYVGQPPRNLGNNTRILEWIPQNDLLGHPKTRMMVAHGGASGVYEAVAHGVPLLVMPLGGDQTGNAARIGARGLGLVFDNTGLTEDTFRRALHEVLDNEKYTANMKRASGIMNDRLAPPNEVAAFWIEHVIKFGSDHLRLRAAEMNFIQLHSIDVLAFIVLVITMLVLIFRWTCIRCCSSLRGQTSTKTKTE